MNYFNDIEQLYFDWLCDKFCGMGISYNKLILKLYLTPYHWVLPLDKNRASDGLSLRERFNQEYVKVPNISMFIDKPCSVLEMMIALCVRCEEEYTYSDEEGDRIGLRFWSMLVNLGLGHMDNENYDENIIIDILRIFMANEYQSDGSGGLFKLSGNRDATKMEIWSQLMASLLENEKGEK